MRTPRVSVVMPVYNAMPYLKEAIESLLTQTFADIEIVALDDESTDGSGEFLQSIEDPRMRVVRCEKRGIAFLRNKGLELVRGEYYAVMDADDVALPSRIERQVAVMDRNPEIVGCGSQAMTIDAMGNEIRPRVLPQSYAEIFVELATGLCPMMHSATTVRMQAMLAVAGYASNRSPAEDFDLWWRLCGRGRLVNHPEVLLKYRWHAGNVSIVQRELQARQTREIIVDHMLANGFALSANEGDAFVNFLPSRAAAAASIGKREIMAFSAVSARLSRFVACSPLLGDAVVGEMRRRLRWVLIGQRAALSASLFETLPAVVALVPIVSRIGRISQHAVAAVKEGAWGGPRKP